MRVLYVVYSGDKAGSAHVIASETPPQERGDLFLRKISQCKVVFDFNDASSELKGKQIKAQTLTEMLEYITSQRGIITESIYPEVVNMVRLFTNSHVFYF